MSIKDRINGKIREKLKIDHLEIIDDSDKHAGHTGWQEGGETHFTVIIMSPDFKDKNRVTRHKMVYDILREELSDKVHALSIKAYAPGEKV